MAFLIDFYFPFIPVLFLIIISSFFVFFVLYSFYCLVLLLSIIYYVLCHSIYKRLWTLRRATIQRVWVNVVHPHLTAFFADDQQQAQLHQQLQQQHLQQQQQLQQQYESVGKENSELKQRVQPFIIHTFIWYFKLTPHIALFCIKTTKYFAILSSNRTSPSALVRLTPEQLAAEGD